MRREKLLFGISVLLVSAFIIALPAGVLAQAQNDKITVATIAGFYTDWLKEISEDFEEETGTEVEIIGIDFSNLYEKEAMEMASGTGAYDIITLESTWLPEWAANKWLVNLTPRIENTPTEELDLDKVSPALRSLNSWNGEVYGLPYYTYHMGQFYREDLFSHPVERENFREEYGYPLHPPYTMRQFKDVAEFFTREKGEKLKGETLDKPFYGVGLMAGRYPHIQDEVMTFLWGMGGQWLEPTEKGLKVTANSETAVRALEYYVSLLDYAPPQATNAAYDEVISQLQDGLIAMTGPMYLDQWANAVMTEEEVPGADVEAKQVPLMHGYTGGFTFGISAGSKNKEAAWEFLKWEASKEAQIKFAKGGGTTTRMDIMQDPEVVNEELVNKTGHYPVLYESLRLHEDFIEQYGLFQTMTAGKIYQELMIACSKAASGEQSPEKALDSLQTTITNILKRYGRPDILVEE